MMGYKFYSIMSVFCSCNALFFQDTFDAARRDCACNNKGDLVSIHTEAENKFIDKLAGEEVWIGGRDFVTEGTCKSMLKGV